MKSTRSYALVVILLGLAGLSYVALQVRPPRERDLREPAPTGNQPPPYLVLPSFIRNCCPEPNTVTFPFENPPFSMCVYPRGEDYVVSDSIHNAGRDTKNVQKEDVDILYESHLRKRMLKILADHGDPNAVVLDIGGNIGLHFMFFANAGYNVHVFEPMKSNYDLLACSAISNDVLKKAVINNFGLGVEVSKSCMGADPSNYGSSKMSKAPLNNCTASNIVEVRRLDTYLEEKNIKPYLVKIDVEGYEFKALQTAKELFRKDPPAHIFSEFVPRHLRDVSVGDDPEAYLQFFYDLGYKLEWGAVADIKKGDANYQNLLATDFSDIHLYRS